MTPSTLQESTMDKSGFFVAEIDVLASGQYFAHFGRPPEEPEKRLMFAILQDAVECFKIMQGRATARANAISGGARVDFYKR